MKRLRITLLAVAMALSLLLVAAAAATPLDEFCEKYPDHQRCTTTTTSATTTTTEPSGFAECSFTDGVLDSWHGHAEDDRQCVWNVDNPGDTFRFQIQQDPDSTVEVENLKLPVLIVNEGYVFPSDKCFLARERRPQNVRFPSDGDDLWTFSPGDIGCGDGPYLLTISIQGLKSGSVNLVMTQTPSGG